jgi:hypothetical protein
MWSKKKKTCGLKMALFVLLMTNWSSYEN